MRVDAAVDADLVITFREADGNTFTLNIFVPAGSSKLAYIILHLYETFISLPTVLNLNFYCFSN